MPVYCDKCEAIITEKELTKIEGEDYCLECSPLGSNMGKKTMKKSTNLKRYKMIVKLLDEVELVVGAIDFYRVKEVFESMIELSDEWMSLCKTEIKPELLGPFSPVISHMEVEVEIGISNKGNGHVSYRYSYEHPDGRSGVETVEKVIEA